MPKHMIHFSFTFLTLTALSGVWMRLVAISPNVQIAPYDHILHAHSHMAVLGWTFLAVLIIYFKLTWKCIVQKKQAIILSIATFLVTVLMFIAFLIQGYALYSIILSSVHILIEYWAIIFVWRSLKNLPDLSHVIRRFIKGALVALGISSIGPWSLGAINSIGMKELPIFDMAVYFYLHFQYNGWLYFMLIGLFLYAIKKKGIHLSKKLLSYSFWVYLTALLPAYFLSVLWFDFGIVGLIIAAFGALGQLVGVILFITAIGRVTQQLKSNYSKHIRSLLWIVIFLLVSKSVIELALLHLPFANLIYETRSVVVGYLHLAFLGFISIFIVTLYQMENILEEKNEVVQWGTLIFLIGFFLNEIVLFLSGLLSWLNVGRFSLQNELLLLASILLYCGALLLWYNVFTKEKTATASKQLKKAT